MKTEFKTIAHLYYGCDVQLTDEYDTYIGKVDGTVIDRPGSWLSVKPILRRISSLTEEEEINICEIVGVFMGGFLIKAIKDGTKYVVDIDCSFELTRYLLSLHIDLFNLIESNQAADADSLK